MRITTRWALHILSDASQLPVYLGLAQARGPSAPIEGQLLDAIARGRIDEFGHWPRHQEAGARVLATGRGRGAAPDAAAARTPLVLRALTHLARRFLVWHAGAMHFEPRRLIEWRERAASYVDPDPLVLTAAALDVWSDDPTPRVRPMDARVSQVVTSAPLIPPITLPTIEQLRRAGLREVHRHHSLSRLPSLAWGEALATDARDIEGEPPPPYPSWAVLIRHARALRAELLRRALLACGVARAGDREPAASRVLAMPQRFARASDEGPLTDCTDRAARLPGARQGHTSRERALLLQTIRALARPGPPPGLDRVLHVYLLLYHQVIQALSQPPSGRKGLDRFKSDYADSPWHDVTGRDTVRDSLQQAWRTGGVRDLELKVTPSKPARERIEALLRETESPETPLLWRLFPCERAPSGQRAARTIDPAHRLLRPDPTAQRPAVRLVFHFIRAADAPRRPGGIGRVAFGALRERIHEQALSLMEDASDPRYGPYIVGLDVAGLETECPVEVFAPVLRAMRSPWPIPSLAFGGLDRSRTADFGLSVHAGEEFRHLAEGIRRVVETLDFCGFRAGDRLGHALALGIEPRDWARRWGGLAVMPRRVRLDDLVWMIDALQGLPDHAALLPALERQRRRLCRQIYGEIHDLETMLAAWRLRGEDPLVHRWDPALLPLSPVRRFTRGALQARLRGTDANAIELWWRGLIEPPADRGGAELVEVELDDAELDGLRALQDVVLRRLVEMRVAIEINPSSNLAIGPFDRVVQHPVFRWDPPGDDAAAIRPSIVVGTDDPAIFGSELLHEYGLLALAAEERGAHPREISRWLREFHHNAEAFGFGASEPQTLGSGAGSTPWASARDR